MEKHKPSRVLITAISFFNYAQSVGRAFTALGYDVKIDICNQHVPFLQRLLDRLLHRDSFMYVRRDYQAHIKQVFDTYKPDLVFAFSSIHLTEESLDYFRHHSSKVIVWAVDSIKTYPIYRSHIDHIDVLCCFEKSDVDYYASIGKKAYFVPLAYDPTIYSPQKVDKDVDLCFVGGMCGKDQRFRGQMIERLVEHYPDKRILAYGQYKPLYIPTFFQWLFRKHKDVFMNYDIPPSEVNNLYARSRIALNIHHKQTTYGANQRVFETCGAGIYQICDKNPYIASIFPNGEVGLYSTEEELYTLIDYALSHDMSQQTQAAYNIVMQGHTIEKRIQQILNLLNDESTHNRC